MLEIYHTHLDNFSNISEKAIQHYGEQIVPVASEYVKSEEYADKDALRADSDATNFTIPLLGLFNFSKATYTVINIIIFLLFLIIFGLEGVRGRIKPGAVLKKSLTVLLSAVGALAVGELIAYVCASAAGATFKPFGIVQGVPFDNAAMIVSTVVLVIVAVVIYMAARAKAVRKVSGSMRASAAVNAAGRHAYNVLYGTLSLMFLLSVVLLITLGENMMFLIPLAFATLAMILYHLTNLRVWLLASIVLILLHAFSFYYALAMALTIGAFGAVAMLAFFDIMVLIPLADLYLSSNKKK